MKFILIPISYLFRLAVFIRNALYNSGIFKAKVLNPKIISVGNIAAGGTGKTPFVELVAEYLLKNGKFIVIILKGYKREHDDIKVVELGFVNEGEVSTESLGDEAFLFIENLSNPTAGRGLVITGDDKTKAAKFAAAKFKPEVIIIDDGFQHRKLARDLDIVIINPAGDKHLIPAGRMREPFGNISRANLVVVNMKFDSDAIAENTRNLPRIVCNYSFEGFYNIRKETLSPGNAGVFAFCGIAEPGSFSELLGKQGLKLLGFMDYPDHHNFSVSDLENIMKRFTGSGAEYLITTQKDFVRIKNSELVLNSKSENAYKKLLYNYPLYYAKIKMQIINNEELLFKELDRLL